MRTYILLILTIISSTNLVAQNLKKAFKYLSENDFDRAKVIFDEGTSQLALCTFSFYGNSLIYTNEAYRSHDLYRAFEAINKSVKNMDAADADMWGKLSDYIAGKQTILNQQAKIDLQLFESVKKENTIIATERFLNEAGQSKYIQDAKALYATQRFKQALGFNYLMAYEDFIKEFPDAKEVVIARQKIYDLAYEQVTRSDKLADYQNFISSYPNAPQVDEARIKMIKKEYEMVLLTGSDDAFERFIQKYPGTEQANNLRNKQLQLNYIQARQLNSVNVFNNFLRKFPDSQYNSEIVEIRDSLAYLEAKNTNTPQAYREFVSRYPNAKQVTKVMTLQKDLSYSKAELADLRQKEKYTSRNISKIDFFRVEASDTSKKTLVQSYEIDQQGNIVHEWKHTVAGSDLEIKRQYSEDKLLLLKEEKTVNGIARYEANYFYHTNNLIDSIVKICHQPCEDGLPSGVFHLYYSHYPDRNIKELVIKGENYQKKSSFIINNQKLVSQEIVELNEGEKYSQIKINYQYDFYDRLIQKSTFSGENEISAVETFFYNKAGDITKYSAYDVLGKIRKTNHYAENGSLQSIDIEYPNETTSNHQLICKYSYRL